MNPIIVRNFEGTTLTTLTWRGRPVWIAREIGVALGYANEGRRLVSKIGGEWSEEFISGHDFAVLTGEDIATDHAHVLREPDGFVLASATLDLRDGGLAAQVRGEAGSRARIANELKSVTYHDLRLEHHSHGWYARVVVDV